MDYSVGTGVFNPACFIHTKFREAITLTMPGTDKRVSYLEAFRIWLAGGTPVKLTDRCKYVSPFPVRFCRLFFFSFVFCF